MTGPSVSWGGGGGESRLEGGLEVRGTGWWAHAALRQWWVIPWGWCLGKWQYGGWCWEVGLADALGTDVGEPWKLWALFCNPEQAQMALEQKTWEQKGKTRLRCPGCCALERTVKAGKEAAGLRLEGRWRACGAVRDPVTEDRTAHLAPPFLTRATSSRDCTWRARRDVLNGRDGTNRRLGLGLWLGRAALWGRGLQPPPSAPALSLVRPALWKARRACCSAGGWGPLQPNSSVTGLCLHVSTATGPPGRRLLLLLCREGRGGLVTLLPGAPQSSPSLRVPSSPPAPLHILTSFRKLGEGTPANALSVPDWIPSPPPPSVWFALCDVTVPLNHVTFLQNGVDE